MLRETGPQATHAALALAMVFRGMPTLLFRGGMHAYTNMVATANAFLSTTLQLLKELLKATQ